MGDQSITIPVPIQDKTANKNAYTHPRPKQDSNLQSQMDSIGL